MDELKNLVIQTLETNGILGQLRAQLRSCVFKVIDNQDQVEKGQSSFHWENPQAKKIMQSASGVVCAELIREFLEFYRLDYSRQIYLPEVNLNHQSAMSKEELTRRSGLSQHAESKPILMQLLETFLAGGSSGAQAPAPAASKNSQNASPVQARVEPAPEKPQSLSQAQPPKRKEEVVSKRDSPDFFSGDKQKSANAGTKKSDHERHLEIASQMLEEQSQEERSGFRAEIQKSSSVSQQSKSPTPVAPPSRQQLGNEKSYEFADNYNDDFDDEEIMEDIPADGGHDDTDNLLGSANNYGERPPHRSTIITESAGGFTVSQSLGVDPSVDSLALEDYDHIEPVERVNY